VSRKKIVALFVKMVFMNGGVIF